MLFKNASVYKLTEDFSLSGKELSAILEDRKFTAGPKTEPSSIGWVRPLGDEFGEYVHEINGYIMITMRKDEKVLPASVVNEILNEKIQEKEAEDNQKVKSKERKAMREDIVIDLLPRSFVVTNRLYAYIDIKGRYIVVDSGSSNKAEELLTLLREHMGSLPLNPISTNNDPKFIMTKWLKDKDSPDSFSIGQECELVDSDADSKGVIRCKKEELFDQKIVNHVAHGKQVSNIELIWQDEITFLLDEHLVMKKIKFDTITSDEAMDEGDSPEERFDADFSMCTQSFSFLLEDVLDLFGGLSKSI